MNKKLLSEELERFKLFSNYKPSMTLTENEVILEQGGPGDEQDLSDYTPGYLMGGARQKKGTLNFSAVNKYGIGAEPAYALFKNKGMFSRYPKSDKFALTSVSRALGIGDSEKIPEPSPQPKEIVIPISISTKVEDPFEFDSLDLYPEAEKALQEFFSSIKNVKIDYNMDVYNKFISFLIESKPIIINAYASKDGNPNTKIVGGYKPCKNSGTRGEYDRCLSQARADYIKSRIETEFPELVDVFSAIGHGQSTQFSKTGWPNSESTDETKADRRFDVILPTYEEKIIEPVVDNQVDTEVEDVVTDPLLVNKKLKWKVGEYIPEAPNAVLNCSKDKDGSIIISNKQIFDVLGEDLALKYIPMIGPGDINNSTRGKAVLTSESITVTVGDNTLVWKNWKQATQAQVYDVTAGFVTDFVPAIYKQIGDDLYIRGHAFAIQNLSK